MRSYCAPKTGGRPPRALERAVPLHPGRLRRGLPRGHPGAFAVRLLLLSCLTNAQSDVLSTNDCVQSKYLYDWKWLLDQVPRLATTPCLACYGDDTGGITKVHIQRMKDLTLAFRTISNFHNCLHKHPQHRPSIETFKPATRRTGGMRFAYCTTHIHIIRRRQIR